MVYFKVTDGCTTRRFQMKAGEHSYAQLRDRLTALFPEAMKTTGGQLHLHYTDSEGDQITISTDTEFQETLAQLPTDATWKLHIRLQRKQQTTPSQSGRSAPYRCSFMSPARRLRVARYNPWLPLSHPLPSLHSSLWDFPSWSFLDTGLEEALNRHDKLFEALSKEAKEDHDTKQQPSDNSSSKSRENKENEGEQSKVSKTTETSVPGLKVKNFGSWEPQEYEGPFGWGTMIGPVGYYVSWSSGGNKDQESNKKEEDNREEETVGGEEDNREEETVGGKEEDNREESVSGEEEDNREEETVGGEDKSEDTQNTEAQENTSS